MLNDFLLSLVVAVREIQPEYIDPRPYEGKQLIVGIACGPNGCYDLGPVKSMFQPGPFVHLSVNVFR
jgi:hypothetical protein